METYYAWREIPTSTWTVINKETTASCSQTTIKKPKERLQGRPSSILTTELSNPGVGQGPSLLAGDIE